MNYNDFPILGDEKYKMIQSEYEKFLPFNRKNNINKIYFLLEECRHFCFGLTNKFNTSISSCINESKKIIEKLMDNLHATFSINIEYKHEIKEFNLFTFTKKLIECIYEIKNWNSKEDKEYYKKISEDCMIDLLFCLKTLISSLEKSNLHFFKYM